MGKCFDLIDVVVNAELEKINKETWKEFVEENKDMILKSNENNYMAVSKGFPVGVINRNGTMIAPGYSINFPEKYVRIKYDSDDIVDINIVVPNKVVEVTFGNGDKQKSVCQEDDTFSLELAITICLCKHLMGGSGKYNNTVNKAMKGYQKKLDHIAADKAEEERIAKKRAKKEAYKVRREQRRLEEQKVAEQKEMERQIEIQKQAYIRAMEYMKRGGNMIDTIVEE